MFVADYQTTSARPLRTSLDARVAACYASGTLVGRPCATLRWATRRRHAFRGPDSAPAGMFIAPMGEVGRSPHGRERHP